MSVLNGVTKLLFVAPETIGKEKNLEFFKNMNISFFAVDEAHCISEWGHDFRPEYRKLKNIIKTIGVKPIIALTATATQKVKKDIIKSQKRKNQENLLLKRTDIVKRGVKKRTNIKQSWEFLAAEKININMFCICKMFGSHVKTPLFDFLYGE